MLRAFYTKGLETLRRKKSDTFFLPVKASEKEVKRRCANGRTENILDQISAICLQGIMNKNKLGYNNINITRKQHTVMFNFKTHILSTD